MPSASPRVLLIEDDEGDAVLIRECLSDAGFSESSVLWRRTLADGVTALDSSPECVLLDLGLPDASGLDAVHRLVAVASEVPVIVLTGLHDRSGDDAVAAGAQDYLVKDDITPELLDRSIRYSRERRRALRAELRLRAERSQRAERSRLERGLLPTPLLHSDRVECSTYYQPGSDLAVLGGDFFDVVELPDGRLRAVIGDVMGHGPDEAALGVHLRVAWRTLVLAGHPAPLLCADGATRYLEAEVGPPLGVEGRKPAASAWPETKAELTVGSSLILYTDGLLDGYRPGGESQSLGLPELIMATDRCVLAGGVVDSWLPDLVDRAPATHDDDTAVVVLTRRA